MLRQHANPLSNPLHFAARQRRSGPPVTLASAARALPQYDYVIVGAGAAGCVLASKLSEDRDVSVLLLEAGGPHEGVLASRVPLMFFTLFHSEHDWDYQTTEQPQLAARRLYWPRGRILGGSTALNGLMYHHCARSDFDDWAAGLGCPGWGYDDLAPYFRRMERFAASALYPDVGSQHRGGDGPWHTGYARLTPLVGDGFMPACREVGIPATPDVNTPGGTLGVTHIQSFIDPRGERSSMATAFLPADVMRRPNLFVACHSHVSRVLFDRLGGGTPVAIGVEFARGRGEERFEVHASREVILCGGAVNTPQLLMLSGVGPADELARHGISVVSESGQVGENLKDHLCPTGILCKAKPGSSLDYLARPGLRSLAALLRWKTTGGGPLAGQPGEAAAFIKTSDFEVPSRPEYHGSGGAGPDVEIVGAPLAFVHHGEEPAPDGSDVLSLVPVALRPQSKGSVTLRSADPFDPPVIDPKYLSDEGGNDAKVLLAGLRVCLKIMRSPALDGFLEPVSDNDDPTSAWWPYSSSRVDDIPDEHLARFMKEKAFTLYHPVGTARMGPEPASSVVDVECRVHGVERLRVMDASVFPEQISGHPTAPIGAMAYKLSDMIRKARAAGLP